MSSQQIGEGKYVISVDSSGAVSQLSQFDSKVKQTSQSVSTSFKSAATSAVGLASGIGSLYFQYDNLEKVELRIRKATLEVSRAQEEVNRLHKEGRDNTLDYSQAQERLNIAKERQRILTDDLKQAEVALGFSFAQTALTIPTTIASITSLIAARTAQTTATAASTTANWANTFSMLANPLFAIPTAAAIATAVGLVATNTWGLRDAIFGTTEAVKANTDGLNAYADSIDNIGNTASGTSSSLVDLNKQMDHTMDLLKKNEISDELDAFKESAAETLLIMGSLEQVTARLGRDGVTSWMDMLSPDNRKIYNSYSNDFGFIDALFDRNFTAKGMTNAQAKILSAASAAVSNYFREIKADARNGLTGLSFTKQLHGNLGFLGGITQAQTSAMINGGKTGSTARRSGTSRAQSGFGGNKNSPMSDILAFSNLFGLGTTQSTINTQFSATTQLLMSEGIPIPNYQSYGVLSPGQPTRGGAVYIDWERYGKDYAKAIAEATRRKETRITDFMNRSGLSRSEVTTLQTTQQGMDDLYGIIDYRDRLMRASSGTG